MPYPKRKKMMVRPKWKLHRNARVVLYQGDRRLGNATYVGKVKVWCWLSLDDGGLPRLRTAANPEVKPDMDDEGGIDVNVFPVMTPKFRMWESSEVCERIRKGTRVPVRYYYGTQVRWEPWTKVLEATEALEPELLSMSAKQSPPDPFDFDKLRPDRVVIDKFGQASPTTPLIPNEHSTTPFDVIFFRNDGWTLGAPQELETVAFKMWRDKWVAYARRGGNGKIPIAQYERR